MDRYRYRRRFVNVLPSTPFILVFILFSSHSLSSKSVLYIVEWKSNPRSFPEKKRSITIAALSTGFQLAPLQPIFRQIYSSSDSNTLDRPQWHTAHIVNHCRSKRKAGPPLVYPSNSTSRMGLTGTSGPRMRKATDYLSAHQSRQQRIKYEYMMSTALTTATRST